MPDLPNKSFKNKFECGLYQENGTCDDCLALAEGNCKLLACKSICRMKDDTNSSHEFIKENRGHPGSINRRVPSDEFVSKMIKDGEEISIENLKSEEYAVIVNGRKCSFEYEEMVELLGAMHDCSLGNESFTEAKVKTSLLGKFLPVTDY